MFRRELKNNVKIKLMCYNRIIDDLNSFIKIFIELDNRLYKLTMNISHNRKKHDRAETYYRKSRNNHSSRQCLDSKPALLNSYKAMSMKLNFMQCKKKNLKKKQKEKNNKTCYLCDKLSHFTKNCKLKNMMQQQSQLNALLQVILKQ